jgi:hypothetical protein
MLPIQAYNLAAANRWILVIPIKRIDENFSVDNITLNLTAVNVPEMRLEEDTISYRGRGFPVPTGVKEEDKTLFCRYMLSEDWHQYRILYKWHQKISNEYNGHSEDLNNLVMPMYLYVMSDFKKPLFSIEFTGCWMKSIGAIDLSYQNGHRQIEHSFNVRYALMEFDDDFDI